MYALFNAPPPYYQVNWGQTGLLPNFYFKVPSFEGSITARWYVGRPQGSRTLPFGVEVSFSATGVEIPGNYTLWATVTVNNVGANTVTVRDSNNNRHSFTLTVTVS